MNNNRCRSGKERRSCTRVQLKLSTSVLLVKIDAYHSGIIANLSLGGCYFPADHGLPLGENCQVEITIGEGLDVDKIRMSGRVARVDSDGAGIEFIDNSPDIMERLKDILLRYSPPE